MFVSVKGPQYFFLMLHFVMSSLYISFAFILCVYAYHQSISQVKHKYKHDFDIYIIHKYICMCLLNCFSYVMLYAYVTCVHNYKLQLNAPDTVTYLYCLKIQVL